MAGWHRSWDETSRHVPVKPLSAREGTAGRGGDTIRAVVAPADREGTNLNLGLLPCLDFGPGEGKPDLPSRDDVARELEAFLNLNGEMTVWPEDHPRVISELFDGEAKWGEVESGMESRDSRRIFPRLTESPPSGPGKRHRVTRGTQPARGGTLPAPIAHNEGKEVNMRLGLGKGSNLNGHSGA